MVGRYDAAGSLLSRDMPEDFWARMCKDLVPAKKPRRYNAREREKMMRYESVPTYEPQTTIYKDHL
jgi:hypothetical protein